MRILLNVNMLIFLFYCGKYLTAFAMLLASEAMVIGHSQTGKLTQSQNKSRCNDNDPLVLSLPNTKIILLLTVMHFFRLKLFDI